MTEFHELVKEAPNFNAMERGELVTYAYAMFAAGTKADSENAKLREGLADAPKCETCEAMLDCDECLRADGSHKERRRLSAENAKLREERDNYKALWEHATVTDCELRRVRAAWKEDREQNAKLRELCKAWREFAYEIFDECFGEPELNEDFMTLDDRMEALGIEVDE